MDDAGYGVKLGNGAPGKVVLEVHNCVYSELALEFPDIVCRFDRGTVCGMLGVDRVGAHADAASSATATPCAATSSASSF